jgi:hypothetical protein
MNALAHADRTQERHDAADPKHVGGPHTQENQSMGTVRKGLGWLLPVLLSVATLWPIASHAQPSGVDPEAIKLLRGTTDYLAGLKQFRVEADTAIDMVLFSGQKLQFGHRIALSVQRPNKLRAERIGELTNQIFYYDGTSLSLHFPDQKYFATVPAPPAIDGMLDLARDKLNVIAPAADLVYNNAFERLTEGLSSAFVVGEAVVGGVRCIHIAFSNPEVDWQIWIQRGDKPLPRKFVVTSKRMPQSPQFAVTLSKWDVSPKLTDAMFHFVPPKGSRQIDFVPAAPAAK